MIVSNDTIINYDKPPYDINSQIVELISAISERIGEANAIQLTRPAAELRKSNRIKTIQSSLAIEGNTLTEEQITALVNNKRVLAPQKDILEVQNAILVYDQLLQFKPDRLNSFLSAHKLLMKGLIKDAGKLRSGNVGIVKGSQVAHIAPSPHMVQSLMTSLFDYVKHGPDHILIKSCVFHYEMEFIHPFTDGNGRMGRLWQTLLLIQKYPLFEYLPVESLIKAEQVKYYAALNQSDSTGKSTTFIIFMLEILLRALNDLLNTSSIILNADDRLSVFKSVIGDRAFSRKDYLLHFKTISPATASRDLTTATEQGMLIKSGDKSVTVYRYC